VRIVVVAVGRLRPPYADDVQHYRKLLAGHTRLEMIEVREGDQVAKRLPERAFVSMMHSEGEQRDSVAFAQWLEERRQSGRDLCFVIGGAFGLQLPEAAIDHKLSLGPMTLPHQLARVVLLEQLYRGHKILAREPYHH
jgi:23S rRNA (pseudouridine1915-N3)-methyltransferase